MSNFDPTSWIQKKRIKEKLSEQTGPETVNSLLQAPNAQKAVTQPALSRPLIQPLPPKGDWWAIELETFFDLLVLEQLNHPEELLKLNPSRREAIARFLAEMSQQAEPIDPQQTLKNFVRLDRTPVEQEAIKQLFKQIAFVQIGKALLLRSWNKKTNLPFQQSDLKDLTSSIEKALRPFIHLQTSTWQLIQKNFYSWYKMTPEFQERLWNLFSRMGDEDEKVRDWLLNQAIHLSAETLGERQRYQEELYKHLWKHLEKSSILDARFSQNLKKKIPTFAYCPTLRDGSIMQHAPESIQWVGFESLTFELIFCEIRSLWNKPQTPFLWVKGSGLELCMEPQSNLLVTNDGRMNVLQQIEEITSCDLAFIAEETPVRTQARTLAAQSLRKQVEQHSVLRKLKHPNATRGMYQACQAMDKLRQNGIMIWAREELLSEASGKTVLQYILNEAKLLMIADFTALQCDDEKIRLNLPKALYIFKRENQMEERKNHRPILIKAYGSLRQNQEVALLFERVFAVLHHPESIFPAEPFALHARLSPVGQIEWEQHWLNPSDDHLVERIEDLKRHASPLGQLAVVRSIPHPQIKNELMDSEQHLFDHHELSKNCGFFAWAESHKNGCELLTSQAHHPPRHLKPGTPLFWIVPSQESWLSSLQMLLRSSLIQDWLNYTNERKKGVWVLKEQDLKSIPVPKHIDDYLKLSYGTAPLSPDERHLLEQIAIEPNITHHHLQKHFQQNPLLRAATFERAAEVLLSHETNHSMLFSLILSEDQMDWQKLIQSFLPDPETATLNQHPLIRFSSTLPPHFPIHQVTSIKQPSAGILLANNKGLTQQLFIQHAWLRDLTLEQIHRVLRAHPEPTFAELCAQIRLPKNPDHCLNIGQQLLKTFSQEKMRRKELVHLMGACLINENLKQPQVGLLQ